MPGLFNPGCPAVCFFVHFPEAAAGHGCRRYLDPGGSAPNDVRGGRKFTRRTRSPWRGKRVPFGGAVPEDVLGGVDPLLHESAT